MSTEKKAVKMMFGGSADAPFLKMVREDRVLSAALREVLREASGWDKLPPGWTQKSVEKFWDSLTGDAKHKVTKCMEQMKGKVDDTGAFCGSLADKIEGTTMWRGKTADAAPEDAFDAYELPVLSTHILMEAKKWLVQNPSLMNRSPADSLKPMLCGLIQQAWAQMPGESGLARLLWTIFEGRGPSQNDDADRAGLVDFTVRKLGKNTEGKLHLAAVSLDLLRRARMPKLADNVNALYVRELSVELKGTAAPAGSAKAKSRAVIFTEEAQSPEIQSLAQDAITKLGKDPKVLETFMFLVAEDANWHSVQSIYEDRSVTAIASAARPSNFASTLDWSVDRIAVLGVAIFVKAGMKAKAKDLMAEALQTFPDAWVDFGMPKRGATDPSILTKHKDLAMAYADAWADSFGVDALPAVLTAHIVGLGKAEFEKNVKDPTLVMNRAKKRMYKENFFYAIPYPEDYGVKQPSQLEMKWGSTLHDASRSKNPYVPTEILTALESMQTRAESLFEEAQRVVVQAKKHWGTLENLMLEKQKASEEFEGSDEEQQLAAATRVIEGIARQSQHASSASTFLSHARGLVDELDSDITTLNRGS